MPRKCCVPECRGNYDENTKISVFSFPVDPVKRSLWMNKIPRANFQPTKQSVVCASHFSEQFIVRWDSAIRPDGSVLAVERSKPKLTDDAYPSIFPNCPSYLSHDPPAKRRKPDERRAETVHRDECAFKAYLEKDKIADFAQFTKELTNHTEGNKWLCRLQENTSSDADQPHQAYWSLYHIRDSNTVPKLVSAMKIFADMHVEVFTDRGNIGIARVPDTSLRWLFPGGVPLILTTWSQFDSLLSHFSGTSDVQDLKTQLQVFIVGLQGLCVNDKFEESVGNQEGKVPTFRDKLLFLVEQLTLLTCPVKRYSSDTLLWAFQIFATTPTVYSLLRNTLLTLPHTSYLKRLVSTFGIRSGMTDSGVHEEYLKQKCQNLNVGERNVVLMLDEIHISSKMSYKQGRLEGSAVNCDVGEANTAQVFMISSLLSKSKDVVATVPVKNLTAAILTELLMKVLEMLHKIGYVVVCVISDNNRVNRSAFTHVCGGKLELFIQNPFNVSQKIFFLFDTVHLFKCIRNNWLVQKDSEKSFLIPSLDTEGVTVKASFSHVRKLFSEEQSSPVKLAPALNPKSLFPTSTEKQNVKLMLNIFDRRNVLALCHFEKVWQVDTGGTREFLTTILRLWDILNVKHPSKHLRLRNEDCRCISSSSDASIIFIRKIINWLQEWKMTKLKLREGILSTETMTALDHTLRGLIEVSSYLLDEKNFTYVLLGKFQTDNLEFRFSQYRQLSGSNYYVSVQQLLESEKKLKLMSVLKLVSASRGSVTLKDITEPLEEKRNELSTSSDEDYKAFLHVLPECDNTILNAEQLKALVFVSGYTVSKVLPQTDCDVCKNELRLEKKLEVEGTTDCYTYLSALDRGGLTWPTDHAVEITTQIFKIFQVILAKESVEQQLLSCGNQRQVLMMLSLKRIQELGLSPETCEDCGKDCQDLITRLCKPAVNIFLNNYSKHFCEKATSGSNVRKLKTLNKKI